MPLIEFKNQKWEVSEGKNLRKALLEQGLSPHNNLAKGLNCKGLGTCGTCALEVVEGKLPPLNAREKWRLNFPPHKLEQGLRLACQIKVQGPMVLRKHPGFWGQHKKEAPLD